MLDLQDEPIELLSDQLTEVTTSGDPLVRGASEPQLVVAEAQTDGDEPLHVFIIVLPLRGCEDTSHLVIARRITCMRRDGAHPRS